MKLKFPRIEFNVNFYKVVVGVAFSLIWAKVMYVIWEQPSYLTFIWFYLVLGSIIVKWGLFEIVDRINLRLRLRALKKELDESARRVREAKECERQNNHR